MSEFEEVAEKASEIIELFFCEMDPDNWLYLEEREEDDDMNNGHENSNDKETSNSLQKEDNSDYL